MLIAHMMAENEQLMKEKKECGVAMVNEEKSTGKSTYEAKEDVSKSWPGSPRKRREQCPIAMA